MSKINKFVSKQLPDPPIRRSQRRSQRLATKLGVKQQKEQKSSHKSKQKKSQKKSEKKRQSQEKSEFKQVKKLKGAKQVKQIEQREQSQQTEELQQIQDIKPVVKRQLRNPNIPVPIITKNTPVTYDKSKRPLLLTNDIFPALYNNMIRVRGVVQVVEIKKKRQNCYSVRVSDGHHRIKVIAMGQAGKQLAKEKIKQYHIIQCLIDHQGQGICLLKTIIKWFQYGFCIGFTQPWKFNRINYNTLGTTKIDWQKWDTLVQNINFYKQQDQLQKIPKMQIQMDQTLTISKPFNNDTKDSKTSKRQLSTCKTQSISISGSVQRNQAKIELQESNTLSKKSRQPKIQKPIFRITQEAIFESYQKQKQQQTQQVPIRNQKLNKYQVKQKQQQKQTLNNNSNDKNKNNLKNKLPSSSTSFTKNKAQQSFSKPKISSISKKDHQEMLKKSQVKHKKLLLKQNTEEEEQEEDDIFNENVKYQVKARNIKVQEEPRVKFQSNPFNVNNKTMQQKKYEKQPKIKENPKNQSKNIVQSKLSRQPSVKPLSSDDLQDSLDNFLQDFVVYQQMKKSDQNKHKNAINQIKNTDYTNQSKKQSTIKKQQEKFRLQEQQKKKKLLQEIFDEIDSDNESQGSERVKSNKQKEQSKKNLIKKQTMTYSPKTQKSKLKMFDIDFQSIFQDYSQKPSQIIQLDSKLPPVKIQSRKKDKVNNSSTIQKGSKISLKWISKQLSNIKKQNKIQIQQRNQQSKQWSSVKVQIKTPKHVTYSKSKISAHNQLLNSLFTQSDEDDQQKRDKCFLQQQTANYNLQQGQFNQKELLQGDKINKDHIFSIHDLIQAGDQNSFITFKGISYIKQWYLRIKILYIESPQNSHSQKQLSNFIKPHSKIKETFYKCLACSQDNKYLCTVMISKEIFHSQQFALQPDRQYLILKPSINQNISKQNQQASYPYNMYQHWIQVSSTKKSKFLPVSSTKSQIKSNIYNCDKQLWINDLSNLEGKKDGDVVNIIGFVKTVRQNRLFNNNAGSKLVGNNEKSVGFNNESSNSKQVSNSKFQSFTNNKNSNQNDFKTMTLVDIIDPLTGFMTSLTDFTQAGKQIKQYAPICIFRARINLYRNKKSLITKPDTIIINYFIKSKISYQLKNFYYENQQNFSEVIENVEIQLTGYKNLSTISQVFKLPQNCKVHLLDCKFFSVKKVSYIGCKKCAKKIVQGKCPTCGLCKKQDVIQKQFYSGLIGDENGSLKFSMNQNVGAKLIKQKLKQKQKQQQLESNSKRQKISQKIHHSKPTKPSIENILTLLRAQIWFTYQNKQKPITLQKILPISETSNIKNLLDFIKSAF